ncbi:MAG: cell shape-determining protein MreC [Oceanicoccus sp.]
MIIFHLIYKDITEDAKLKANLAAKMEQLEKMNKHMMDRELKMVELKEENEALRKRLNE